MRRQSGTHRLTSRLPDATASRSAFPADPGHPVMDPHDTPGPRDYSALASREDLLTFDTDPLPADVTVAGNITGTIYASCDCRDFDLWVRLQDVHPDGRAFNLMSAGNDVLRASYRDPVEGPATGRARTRLRTALPGPDDGNPVRKRASHPGPGLRILRPAPVAQPADRRVGDRVGRSPARHDHDPPRRRPRVEAVVAGARLIHPLVLPARLFVA